MSADKSKRGTADGFFMFGDARRGIAAHAGPHPLVVVSDVVSGLPRAVIALDPLATRLVLPYRQLQQIARYGSQ